MANINYGDNGVITKYLQYFLRDNYSDVMKMSWSYDEYTHNKLLEYLDTPNYITSNEILDHMLSLEFDVQSSIYERLRFPFEYMQNHIEENTVVFFLKNPLTIEGYMDSDFPNPANNPHKLFKALIPILSKMYDSVKEFVETNGWRIAEYPSLYKEITTITEDNINDLESITVVFKTKTPTNLFPHFDFRYMVNYFNNKYVNNYDVNNNLFMKSSNYRVALLKCKPNDTFIISHGYTYSIPIKVGYCESKLEDVIDTLYTSTNMTSLKIQGMSENNLHKFLPSIPMVVKVPNDKNYQTLLIVIPKLKYTKQDNIQTQSPLMFSDVYMRVGDINNDGDIDEIDRLIYACQRPQDVGRSDIIYFNTSYSRFIALCECIEDKYEKLTLVNGNETKYNNFILSKTYDEYGNVVYNIDNIVKHLRFLCNGTDIEFKRYLINGEINYKIIIGDNLSSRCIKILNDNNFSIQNFDTYLNDTSIDSLVKNYIYDTNEGYALSQNPTSKGTEVICGKNMTSNNLLVIKANPYDNITGIENPCYKIIYGSHNTDDVLSLPLSDFKENAWMVRNEFISAILDYVTNQYSRQEDISYLYKLIATSNSTILSNDEYIYTEKLREFIRDLQIKIKTPFSFGYANGIVYDTLYSDTYNDYAKRNNK